MLVFIMVSRIEDGFIRGIILIFCWWVVNIKWLLGLVIAGIFVFDNKFIEWFCSVGVRKVGIFFGVVCLFNLKNR